MPKTSAEYATERATEPIMAAIRLYMDIINLFLYLLQAMSSGQRD